MALSSLKRMMVGMTISTEGEASVTDTKPKSRSEIIRDIRTSDKTYFVKNNTANRVTCSTSKPPLSLGPTGMGEDVAILPKSALDEPGFQRMWIAGKLTITDDQSIEDQMVEAAGVNQANQDAEAARLAGIIEEPSSNRDLIQKKCLVSGETVYQTQADINNMVPPLAPAYKNRASEFIPSVSSDGQGNEVVKFSKATVEK